jgi:2'-5' RNA ligase
MDTLVTKTPGGNGSEIGLQEYLLVAHPDNVVNEKVMVEKKLFTTNYHQKIAVKTLPHITIANFLAREEMEDTIIRYTQRICSQQASFNVELNNYSGFPPSTIYLRVQNPHPFKVLAKELKVIGNYVKSCSCPSVRFISNPHLTIARRIPEPLFHEVLMEYSQKAFHETFMVNELVLLRRSHQYDTCKKVHVFRLQPPGYKPFEHTLFN